MNGIEIRAGAEPAEALRRAAAASRVVVVGSLNMDLIVHSDREPEDDGSVVAHSIVTAPGGHAGNCAAALAALGVPVGVAAAIGADPDGDALLTDLRGRGVDTHAVHRYAQAPTGRVIIPVFPDKHYMLMHRGANDLLSGAKVRDALARPPDAVIMFDPSREAVLEAAAAARSVHRPGRRPLLCWCPGGVYAGDPLAAEILPYCDVLLLNRDERRHLDPLIRSSRPDHPQDVVTTLGAEGAVVCRDGQEWSVPAVPARVVDPTGAGDAFTAAYVLAALAGLNPATRARVGNAGGARAIGAVGARAGVATLPELLAALSPTGADSAPVPHALEPT